MTTPVLELGEKLENSIPVDDAKHEHTTASLDNLEEELSRATPVAKREGVLASPSPTYELERILGLGTIKSIKEEPVQCTTSPIKARPSTAWDTVKEMQLTPVKNDKKSSTVPNKLAPNKLAPNKLAQNKVAPKKLAPSKLVKEKSKPKKKKPSALQVLVKSHEDRCKIEKALCINPTAVVKLLGGYYRHEQSDSKQLAQTYKRCSGEMSQLDKDLKETQRLNSLLRDMLDLEVDEEGFPIKQQIPRTRNKRRGQVFAKKLMEFEVEEMLEIEENPNGLNLGILCATPTSSKSTRDPLGGRAHAEDEH